MTAQPNANTSAIESSLVRIGCSGWQYKHWRGDFYPRDLTLSRWLEFYAERFDTVEINNSFYRLPDADTFAAWRKRVQKGFVYAVKASRFLTHMKKLKDPEEPLQRFFTRAGKLGPKLGPVLYQLPPRWPVNLERFDHFLAALPPRHRHVVEFRDPTWYRDDVLERLERHEVTLCLHDMAGAATPRINVGPFVYVRFHGTTKYGGRYGDEAIAEWAEWLAACARRGVPVYAYFNNDTGGHAPRDAVRLRDDISQNLQLTRQSSEGPCPSKF